MEKIKDERLQLRNLKNIRIVFIVQTLGILGILGYEWVTEGFSGMTGNPLWYVFMVSVIVNAYLSMGISVDHEEEKTTPKKSLYVSIGVVTILTFLLGLFVTLTDGYGFWDGLLIGGIVLVCFLVPLIYIYYLRKKRLKEEE